MNRHHRRTVRQDIPVAKVVQTQEEIEQQKERLRKLAALQAQWVGFSSVHVWSMYGPCMSMYGVLFIKIAQHCTEGYTWYRLLEQKWKRKGKKTTCMELKVFIPVIYLPIPSSNTVCVGVHACVRACECVVSVIVKCPVLPPNVVDGCSRNPLYYYYYYMVLLNQCLFYYNMCKHLPRSTLLK